jgi:hypothetical protein
LPVRSHLYHLSLTRLMIYTVFSTTKLEEPIIASNFWKKEVTFHGNSFNLIYRRLSFGLLFHLRFITLYHFLVRMRSHFSFKRVIQTLWLRIITKKWWKDNCDVRKDSEQSNQTIFKISWQVFWGRFIK